jgi:hypothetical protein
VDQCEAPRLPPSELVERPLPRLEVDLRRRGGGVDEATRVDPHAGRVARVERPVLVEVRDVVARVAGRGEAGEPDDVLAHREHVCGRDRGELAPELVERVAVEAPRARLEPLGVDEVRQPDLGDVHGEGRVLADEHPRRAGVVEVDVREEQVAEVAELEPARPERVPERRHAGRRSAVEQRGAVVGVDQVRPDPPAVAEVEKVERGVCHDTDAIGG